MKNLSIQIYFFKSEYLKLYALIVWLPIFSGKIMYVQKINDNSAKGDKLAQKPVTTR